MHKLSSYSAKLALCLLIFLTFSCQPDYTLITSSKLESLLKAEVVERVIVIPKKALVEIHLDELELSDSPFANEFESTQILALEKVNDEYFVEKYNEMRNEYNLINAPNLSFEDRPNFMDFLATYGLLFVLLLMILAVFIIFPVIIFSQKKKIKNLEAQVRMLHDQKSSSDQK